MMHNIPVWDFCNIHVFTDNSTMLSKVSFFMHYSAPIWNFCIVIPTIIYDILLFDTSKFFYVLCYGPIFYYIT